MNLIKYYKIIFFLFIFLFSDKLFSHGFANDYKIGFRFNYLNDGNLNNINLDFTMIPRNANYSDELFKLGLNIRETTSIDNIKINFILLNIQGMGSLSKSTIQPFNLYGELGIINIKHSSQLSTDIDWLNFAIGYCYSNYTDYDNGTFIGGYSGLGINSTFLDNNIRNFDDKEFHGFLPKIGIIFNYSNKYLTISSKSEVKGVVFDKFLFIANPKIELYFDLSELFYPTTYVICKKCLQLNAGYSLTYISQNNDNNTNHIFKLGLFYSVY